MLVGLYQRIVSDTRLRRRLECSIAPFPPRATFGRKVSIVPIHHTAVTLDGHGSAVPLPIGRIESYLLPSSVGDVQCAYDLDVSDKNIPMFSK